MQEIPKKRRSVPMSTETPYNPYAAFENMADEDVVLKAK